MSLAVFRSASLGQDAPDFTLRDQDANPVSLASLRGQNIVLVFYPADETTLCTRQLCEFRENWALARSKDAVVSESIRRMKRSMRDSETTTGFLRCWPIPGNGGADYRPKG